MKKSPNTTRCWNSNPWNSKHESPPIITRPELPPNLLNKGQCVCVCLSVLYKNPKCWTDQDEIWHGGGPRGGEGSWGGGGRPCTPTPWGACKRGSGWLSFGKNIMKQKLQGAPDLVGAGHLFGPQIQIWKDLGPMSFWSHGHSLWRGVHKIKAVMFVTKSYLVRSDTLYPDLWGPRGAKGVWRGSGA